MSPLGLESLLPRPGGAHHRPADPPLAGRVRTPEVGTTQDDTTGDRTAADLECELAMLASVRAYLTDAEEEDFRLPTTAVAKVLDELGGLDRKS